MEAKTDNSKPSGFEIVIREMWGTGKKRNIRFWEAKDSAGNVCRKLTAEEAVKGVREMYWLANIKSLQERKA